MVTEVSKDLCIGCGLCPDLEPTIYQMDDDGKASAIHEELNEDESARARIAADSCPVDAIVVD